MSLCSYKHVSHILVGSSAHVPNALREGRHKVALRNDPKLANSHTHTRHAAGFWTVLASSGCWRRLCTRLTECSLGVGQTRGCCRTLSNPSESRRVPRQSRGRELLGENECSVAYETCYPTSSWMLHSCMLMHCSRYILLLGDRAR